MGKFTFGPVPSRRLGFSLGVDVVPKKYCTFDCVYCQVGKTTEKGLERKRFFDPEEIVDEIISETKRLSNIDIVTFSGSGEPTLNPDIGWMIKETKKLLKLPICVITNSSLLFDEKVRLDLDKSDLILPSFDAASEEVFRSVNRPHPAIDVDKMVEGLKRFRAGYKGKFWLEVMLIKGLNDTQEELQLIGKAVKLIGADKVQLNTVTRPPTEETARALGLTALEKISGSFGDHCEIICRFEKKVKKVDTQKQFEAILNTLSRRALTLDDIVRITGVTTKEAKKELRNMEVGGMIRSTLVGGTIFYQKVEE